MSVNALLREQTGSAQEEERMGRRKAAGYGRHPELLVDFETEDGVTYELSYDYSSGDVTVLGWFVNGAETANVPAVVEDALIQKAYREGEYGAALNGGSSDEDLRERMW